MAGGGGRWVGRRVHPLVAVHGAAFAVSDATGWPSRTVLVSLVAVAAGVAVLLVHPLVTPVSGRVRAVGAQLVVVALVATSPWVAVPYTDILAMPCSPERASSCCVRPGGATGSAWCSSSRRRRWLRVRSPSRPHLLCRSSR
jgi:hypothetical protein